ncbi:MAG: hypothetical protein K8T25_22740 [Planctomycetia bacterium]|nr:hypothetical protein [Planctomycetia bacterium]
MTGRIGNNWWVFDPPYYLVALPLIFLLSSAALAAGEARPQIAKAEIGFGGHYKLGYWTPLSVTVSGLAEKETCTLEVTVPDSDGAPTQFTQAISVASHQPLSVRLYVKIGRATGDMTVAVRNEGQIVARRTFDLAGGELLPAMPSDAWLVLTLGRTQHLAATLAADKAFHASGGEVVAVEDAAQLPTEWYGYEGVDAVLISGTAAGLDKLLSDPAESKNRVPGATPQKSTVDASGTLPQPPKLRPLDKWLRRGGTVIVTAGTHAEKLLSPGSALSHWIPGAFDRLMSLTTSGALEKASGVESPLETLTEGEPLRLDAARLKSLSGSVLAYSGSRATDLPLIVQRAFGFGRVLFLAVDLDEPIFGRWSGTGPLLAGLFMPRRGGADAETTSLRGEVTHTGYDDLSGQLRASLDQFQPQGVSILPFWLLLVLLMSYVALLGPGDYFFLSRVLRRRMELTWLTLPLLILAASGGAYGLARWLKGDELRVNQMDVVDYDSIKADGVASRRATTWFTIFSPHSQAYNLSLRPVSEADNTTAKGSDKPSEDVLLSWLGLPGPALGGMESRAIAPIGSRPYQFAPGLNALVDVPIAVWSTKSFVARWTPEAEAPLAAAIWPSQSGLEGYLSGSVTNRSPLTLENCVLLTGRWAYRLGTLAPGQQLQIRDDLGPRSVASHIRAPREADEAYDRYSLSSARIIELMTFYQKVGGADYTRLKHRYESLVDLSDQLEQEDRAVLLAFSRSPAAEPQDGHRPLVESATGRTAVYRVIVPIVQKER